MKYLINNITHLSANPDGELSIVFILNFGDAIQTFPNERYKDHFNLLHPLVTTHNLSKWNLSFNSTLYIEHHTQIVPKPTLISNKRHIVKNKHKVAQHTTTNKCQPS